DPDAPWEPYVLIAVELAAERMVVLGQAAPGVARPSLAVSGKRLRDLRAEASEIADPPAFRDDRPPSVSTTVDTEGMST
ncbi:hypothetical protein ACWCP1_28700, partial [Streptomyces sp. NPDC001999]